MQVLFKDLLDDPLYQSATFAESIDMVTYELILESGHLDPKNFYDVINKAKGYWVFVGASGVKHFIRIIMGAKNSWQLKMGVFDGDKAVYDRPNLYFNDDIYQYDKKVLNTYIKAFMEDVIPYFFSSLPDGILELPAIDKAHYRLYKMMANKFLDKSKYEIVHDDGFKRFSIKKL